MSTRKKCLLGLMAILALAVVVAFVFRVQLTRKLVDSRIQRNLGNYHEAADLGDWKNAYRFALSAHQLNPKRLDALVALLRVGIQDPSVHRGNLAIVAVKIVHHPAASAGEKAKALKLFLDAGDGVVFLSLFKKLSEEEQKQSEVIRLYASYLASIGKVSDSARILETLLARSAGSNYHLAYELAEVLGRAVEGNAGVATRIQQLVVGMLEHPDRSVGLRALGLLENVPVEYWSCRDLLAAAVWVDGHRNASVAQRLTILSLKVQESPAQRAALLERAKSKFGKAHPEAVARWLAEQKEYQAALLVLSDEVARRTPEGFLTRARILHQAGQLSEADRWLQTPHRGVPPSVVSTLRAVVAVAGDSERWWQKALHQAELESAVGPAAFWRISASAASVGNQEVEMTAATEALKRSGSHPSVDDLGPVFVWLYEENRVEDLRQILRNLIRREPDSAILRNNLAYLEIISGRSNESLVEELRSLHEEFPSVAEIATSLAVAELERGNYQQARDLLQANVVDWKSAPAASVAAFAVASRHAHVTAAQGSLSGDASDELVASIQWKEMLAAEREFFQARLKTTALSSANEGVDGSRP